MDMLIHFSEVLKGSHFDIHVGNYISNIMTTLKCQIESCIKAIRCPYLTIFINLYICETRHERCCPMRSLTALSDLCLPSRHYM